MVSFFFFSLFFLPFLKCNKQVSNFSFMSSHPVYHLIDIQFWNSRQSLEGLSVRSVIFGVFQSLVVLLYILDNETNFVVQVSVGIGLLIDFWKITKVMDVKVRANHAQENVGLCYEFLHSSTTARGAPAIFVLSQQLQKLSLTPWPDLEGGADFSCAPRCVSSWTMHLAAECPPPSPHSQPGQRESSLEP